MDNSWFIQIDELRLLIDPWLEGEEVDYFRWFNTQWHRTKPIGYNRLPKYDYVLITQKYPDHFHKQTLLNLQPAKVIVPASIAKDVKSLLPNAEVIALGKERNTLEIKNVKIKWHPTRRKIDPIYDAYMITGKEESLFLATHGYFIGKEQVNTSQPLKLLISPFNHFQLPFFLGGTVSPGIEGLLHLTEKLSPKYIAATHDEDKHATGLVNRVAKVKRILMTDLLQHEILKDRILELKDYSPVII